MLSDVNLLTTHVECDEATGELEAKVDGLQVKDALLDYADRQGERTENKIEGTLAGVDAEIASYTATLAQPGIPAKLRKLTQSKLRRANDRRDNLLERGEARTGSAAFLAGVDADRITALVQLYTDAIAAVAARRAALPA